MRHTIAIHNSSSKSECDNRGKRSDAIWKIGKSIGGDLFQWMNNAFYFFDTVHWYADLSDEEIASMAADGFEVNE